MKPDAPKPEPAEKSFDQAREEAFSNEGAPPPTEARSKAAAVVRLCSLPSASLPGGGC